MHAARSIAVSLGGFLLTDEEWQDDDLRRALLVAWAERAGAAADLDAYESFEVEVDLDWGREADAEAAAA
ncbi:MAG TPA: hypothetical protein VKZ63_13920 [Kofleriaceae bacterium]|nr:hypothetical protein [Kofleriaceae bacterium]